MEKCVNPETWNIRWCCWVTSREPFICRLFPSNTECGYWHNLYNELREADIWDGNCLMYHSLVTSYFIPGILHFFIPHRPIHIQLIFLNFIQILTTLHGTQFINWHFLSYVFSFLCINTTKIFLHERKKGRSIYSWTIEPCSSGLKIVNIILSDLLGMNKNYLLWPI